MCREPCPTNEPDPVAASRLVDWFALHERDLIWRRDRRPYAVWISEVMLQQTRANTVGAYFERFLDAFPDVHALARAPLEDVLKVWQGLGYYRRARLLHRAAEIVVEQHGGRLPRTSEALRRLPGFGSYTATAVAAFAFGEPGIAVDANVRRVGARYFGLEAQGDGALADRFAGWLAAVGEPRRITEGLIELGATVCVPASPRCDDCPLRPSCRAYATGSPERFGRRAARKKAPTVRKYAWVAADARGIWLARRPPDGLLGGLWGFPQSELAPDGVEIGAIAHAYTHFKLELTVVRVPSARVSDWPREDALGQPAAEHVTWDRLGKIPISGVDQKVLDFLHVHVPAVAFGRGWSLGL